MHVSLLLQYIPITTVVMYVNIIFFFFLKAHSIMQRITESKKQTWNAFFFFFLVNLYKKKSWIIACTNHLTDKHHSAKKKKSDVKLIAMPSIFQRAQVACGGLNYGVRVGKGYCKEWWGENSFTAGWPQGSTFSTGILSWKWERRVVIAFFWVKTSSRHTHTLFHTGDITSTLVTRWHLEEIMLLKETQKL